MRFNKYKSLWGLTYMEQPWGTLHLEQILPGMRQQGYAGVECSVKLATQLNQDGSFVRLMQEQGLSWIPVIFSSGPVWDWDPFVRPGSGARHMDDVQRHLDALAGQMDDAQRLAAPGGQGPAIPIPFYNAHAGHDGWPLAATLELLARVQGLRGRVLSGGGGSGGGEPPPVLHETHRGRALCNAWHTAAILQQLPQLRVIADLSHLCCAAEADPWEAELAGAMAALLPAAAHIHARVGHANGPQVSDPRAPYWRRHTDAFEQWWRLIMMAARRRHEAGSAGGGGGGGGCESDGRGSSSDDGSGGSSERRGSSERSSNSESSSSSSSSSSIAGIGVLLGGAVLGVTCEYGPPSYQPVSLASGQPEVSLQELNDWTAARLEALWQAPPLQRSELEFQVPDSFWPG